MRAHLIGQLLGFDFSASHYLKNILDDPQQIHDRALMYLAEYFQGMSEGAPVVIFLEDIHWVDDSSLNMLNRLVRRIPGQRLLVVCAARHRLYERRPHWGEGLATHHRLELQLLSNLDSSQLVTEILQKVDQIPDSLQDLVVKGAEGNPFYIEELIKMLIEGGIIIPGEEEWRITPERLAEVDVPETLTGVLQARLEGLPQAERILLQQASVVGHIFWDDTVTYLNNQSNSTDTHYDIRTTESNLSSLRSRELIYRHEESAFTDAAEYAFKHALLRDMTYESVLKRVRKAYHGLVAEWLIQHSEERAGEYTGLIADHLELAGKDEQAVIYLYQAGDEAAKRYANEEAVQYYSRALALTPEDDLMGSYDLLLAREKLLDILGNREAQQKDISELDTLAKLLNDTGKQAQVTLRQITYLQNIGDYSEIQPLAEIAIELAQNAKDLECETNIRLQLGRSLWMSGKYEAAQDPLEQTLKLAREHQFQQVEAECLRNLGIVLGSYKSDIELFKSYTEQALNKCRQIGDKRGEALALNNLGTYYTENEINLSRGIDYYEQSLFVNQEIGNRFGEGLAFFNMGATASDQGDYAASVTWLSQALDIQSEIGYRKGKISSLLHLGSCHFNLGEYEQAKLNFTQSLKIAREIGGLEQQIQGLFVWLDFHRGLGDYRSAHIYYKQLKAKWDEVESPEIKAEILFNLGLFKHHLGDDQAAQEYCNQGLQILGDNERHRLQWYGLTYLGHALTAMKELEQAEEVYRQAISLGYETQKIRQAIEAQAGLARVSTARGDAEQALAQVEEILIYLDNEVPSMGHPLDGTKEPFRILLTCYQVLKANNNMRAEAILEDSYHLLQSRATNINDEHLRDCFLNNVAVNREIVAEYTTLGLESSVR